MCPTRLSTDTVTPALLAWQATGDERWLERVIAGSIDELRRVAVRSLRRQRIGDDSAVDDTLSLVFDHLRRLPGATPGERAVARFDASRGADGGNDPGVAFLTWLVHERARDVARSRRRQAQRGRPLADGDAGEWTSSSLPPDDDAQLDRLARFEAALTRLEPRLRTVIELLLEGKSQTVIAHALDVCEGTVSRLRSRAIAELRRLLA